MRVSGTNNINKVFPSNTMTNNVNGNANEIRVSELKSDLPPGGLIGRFTHITDIHHVGDFNEAKKRDMHA
uniref:Uncharacterized protein n=1 Tax=Romanomermis culicivorax TaxID=13658 RepID=A0A915L5A1_ROMCU